MAESPFWNNGDRYLYLSPLQFSGKKPIDRNIVMIL
jgi:hypothetical protein